MCRYFILFFFYLYFFMIGFMVPPNNENGFCGYSHASPIFTTYQSSHTQTTSTYACKREASMPRFWCEGIKRIFSVLEIGVKHTGCFKRCNFPIRLFYQEVRAQFDLFLFFLLLIYMQRDNNAKGKRWWWFTPVWHTVRCTKYFYDRLFSPHIFSKKLLEHLMKCDVFRN